MKKFLLLLVALFSTTIAFAYDVQIDGIYYNLNHKTKTAEVTYHSSTMHSYYGSIIIPETIKYENEIYDITSIGASAFSYSQNLTSVTIPNNITKIEQMAFYQCTSLPSISIPNSITYIGESAFYNTPWLNNQPDGCVYIGKCLYIYKGNKSSMPENSHIDIKEGIIHICDDAFCILPNLKSISFPNNLISIGNGVFRECTSLSSITIPNSVTSIGKFTFYNCSSLTSITIPNNITSIGESAFSGCSALTSISIPNSINSIGRYAFYDCSTLSASISMPNVNTIGDRAFYNCKSLSAISIGNNLKSIDENTFYNCTNLRTIKMGNSIESIGKDAFKGCTTLYSFEISTEIPPIINATTFAEVSSTLQIKVPCNSVEDYKASSHWNSFSNFEGIPHTINVNVNNDKMGQAFVIKQSTCQDITAQILAQALIGHKFVKWNDGYTDNPRTIIVTQDSTFTAEFVANKHNVTLSAENGIVDGAGIYNYGDTITISATPNDGYTFQKWSDGNTDNPRKIIVTEDINLIAILKANSPSTNLDSNLNTKIRIYTTNGTLHVENATENYHILDATGLLIYSGNATTLTLPRGIYLVTMGGEVEKIVL